MKNPLLVQDVLRSRMKPGELDTFEAAQEQIRKYLSAREGLRELGIVRSGACLQSDYGEWVACCWYELRRNPSFVQKGFDAKDEGELRYQVKARLVNNLRSSLPSISTMGTLTLIF